MSKTLQSYLKYFAKYYLRRAKPKIIAITGSVGKTSTKNAIFEVLKVHYGENVRKSHGNLNNETGVPLAILGIKKSPSNPFGWVSVLISAKLKSLFGNKVSILVLEYAADKPGDLEYLTSFAKPQIAVITGIGPAHLEAFGEMENVVKEKTSILSSLTEDGLAIINYDDKNLKNIDEESFNLIKYAINAEADITAKNIFTDIENYRPITKFQVVSNKNKFQAELSTLGRSANIYSALAACAVGENMGLTKDEIIEGLQNIRSESHRMEVLAGIKGSIIIDDSYNANPLSMRSALDTLEHLSAKRKIAVLGDMREIGNISDQAHQLIGEYAHEVANIFIAVGDLAKKYKAENYFEDIESATAYLLNEVQEGDMILIKASRALALDKIAEALRKS